MDFRFLLVLLLPALATAGTYLYEPAPSGIEEGGRTDLDNYGAKAEGDDSTDISASVGAVVLNEGSALTHSAIDDIGMRAKTVEQSAKWYRNLLNEKRMILAQAKKRLNILRSMAAENLQNAEQYRKSAAEKSQTSKALESKAREAQSLSKEQSVQVNELKGKMHSELKQQLNCVINSRVAEANAEIDIGEAQRQKAWGDFLEKLAQDMVSEAVQWERRSSASQEIAKKLKLDAAAESAKGREFEAKRKEAEEAGIEAEKKARGLYFYHMEFQQKAQAEELQVALAKIKAKYHQLSAASMAESATYTGKFAMLENKDKVLWEKKTASAKADAKLLETSANKMAENIEKLKASMKAAPKTEAKGEVVVQEEKSVKAEPQRKVVEVPVKKV